MMILKSLVSNFWLVGAGIVAMILWRILRRDDKALRTRAKALAARCLERKAVVVFEMLQIWAGSERYEDKLEKMLDIIEATLGR
jgi:hypothetical protein